MNDPTTFPNSNNRKLDVTEIRKDFPILQSSVKGNPLVYLDNAASSHMPQCVIDRISEYHLSEHSNIHRAVHKLSEEATAKFEESRTIVKEFLNARYEKEIIFTRGTTGGINLVAKSYGEKFLREGDEVLISHLEHHSNIVPWQMLCQKVGAELKVIPVTEEGEVDLEEYKNMLSTKTKFLSLTHVSNALGTVLPIKEMIREARSYGIPVLVDGAQGVPHMAVDLQDIDCDFYVFSGHKMCGPSGVGVLYGKEEILTKMDPYEGGGDMILSVTFEKTLYNKIPYKFEAGTPPIAQAIGLGRAINYLQAIGLNKINQHEEELLAYATKRLDELSGLTIIGRSKHKAGVISFVMDGVHPHDIGTLLNDKGVAVRTGHHCAQPTMQRFGVPATTRASFYLYNTTSDIDQLINGIHSIKKIFD